MKLFRPLSFVLLFSFAACSSTAHVGAPAAEPVVAEAVKKGADEEAVEKRRGLEKERMQKVRDIEYAKVSVQTSLIDRQIRTMSIEQELKNAELALGKARKDYEQHSKETAPRELEEQRMRLDQQTYRAEEAKDELAELEAMYEADEFAKATKELVIKRGRRQMEMADRGLAIARRELAEYEGHTMPERDRELRQKVADAELALAKARLESDKARLELDVAQRQADDKVKDLQTEIEEVEKKLAEAAKTEAKT